MSINKGISMIEEEIFAEIKEDKQEAEGLLFPKDEWEELVHWEPVSNIPVDEIYENLPEVKRFHNEYCKFWLNKKSR